MKESKYSQKVTDYLIKRGALVDNNTASVYSKVGRSDLTVLYKGYYLALELKTGNYKPTDLQVIYLQHVRDCGGIGLILRDNLDEIKKCLDCLDKKKKYKQPKLPDISDISIVFD